MSDRTLAIVALIQALVIELRKHPVNRTKGALIELDNLTSSVFQKLPDAEISRVQALRNSAWIKLSETYSGEIEAGLPVLIEGLYFSHKEVLDKIGKTGQFERLVNSIAMKIGSGHHAVSYEIADNFTKMLNKVIYDLNREGHAQDKERN